MFWDDDATLGEQFNDWLLDPEDEGNTMLRNVRNYSPTTKRHILENVKVLGPFFCEKKENVFLNII